MRLGRISLLLGFALLSASLGYSQGPSFEWVVRAGAATTFSGGYGIGYDASGNIYATGRFSGTVDFDPGAGTTNLTSAGVLDTYITKVDAGGNLIWARRVGGPNDDYSFDVFVDESGNVYIIGAFSGTADFDPGAGTFNLSSAGLFIDDIFVLKLDTGGNLAWARKIGGADFDFGRSITVSAAGNVFTTGSFRGTVDFDPGPGTSFLTSASGGNDIFISKLDAAGNFVWAKQLGGTGNDIGYAVTVDDAEKVFTTGSFSTTADFDPGPSVFNLTEVNNGDIFISKLDATGSFVWAKGMGGTSSDVGHSIQVDDNGNVYTSGFFHTTVDFDPGPGTVSLVSVGFNDAFICKFDVNGNYLWAKGMGGTSDEESSGLALDEYGNVYATGSFESTVDFDPGSGIFNLTPGGNTGFVVKLDNSGDFVWAQAFEGLGGAIPEAINVDSDESIYITGYFSSTVDFDIGAGVFNVTAAGSNDTFIHKMSQPSTPPTITSFTPGSGPVGTTVTITGTNFSATPANNTVSFNGVVAIVTASTSTSITVTVPSGATTGKISVTVGGNTAVSTTDFIVNDNFVTSWNLATAGSGPTQLSFGTATSGSVNYTWQEISPGSASGSGSWSGATLTITGLPAGATIRLQIAPTNFQRIIIDNGLDANRLTLVEQWGSTAWTSMLSAFYDCDNLQITATDVPNLSGVTNMEEMFSGCITLNSPSNMGSWNTATVTNMRFLFYGATAFNQNIGGWNTGAVTNMSTMFSEAAAFNQDIGSWNTGAVTDMSGMFQYAYAFNQNIGSWNTSAVTNMSSMFSRADSFNQNIAAWNTGAATDMRSMFRLAIAFNQNIGAWALPPTVDIRNMFDDSGMDCTNYSATLIGWSANPSTPTGRTLGAIGRQYGTNSAAARTNLISTKSWTITGDTPSGTVCSSIAVPTITNFTPPSGTIGTMVTISGTNFDTTPTNNTVAFNGTTAVVTASTTTSITTTVPTGATTGKISVTVSGNTATSAADFTVTTATNQPPIISSSTTAAPINGIVTVELLNLLSDPDDNLDLSTLSLLSSTSEQGAAASINASSELELNYGSVFFVGVDRVSIEVCDLLSACSQQELSIEVSGNVIVYNALSPNADGENDHFNLKYIELFPDTEQNRVTIYNRWGDVVWEGIDYDNSTVVFEGTSTNGKDLPTGTYFYKIEFSSGLQSLTGFLSLKR